MEQEAIRRQDVEGGKLLKAEREGCFFFILVRLESREVMGRKIKSQALFSF